MYRKQKENESKKRRMRERNKETERRKKIKAILQSEECVVKEMAIYSVM